ncbi:hypothetical protein NEF87_004642 [Candidatus Lokiarchaeum ossiferum]|uniref:Uncharacterized protein n=1 Tax=Candidatus Lokiarchaeum ossiferum TaxID=2951803 RepID=A0ABY6HZQ3_9ARCH|nr:hypothetical protein NEF87_004642 [Candidatus Lokiarchaeum sp. B-35]
MISDIRTQFQSFTLFTYIYFSLAIIFLLVAYFSIPKMNRSLAGKVISLILVIWAFTLINFPFLWILIALSVGLLYSIFNDSRLQQLFIIDEDILFVDKKPQVWEKFEVPPELRVNNPEGLES